MTRFYKWLIILVFAFPSIFFQLTYHEILDGILYWILASLSVLCFIFTVFSSMAQTVFSYEWLHSNFGFRSAKFLFYIYLDKDKTVMGASSKEKVVHTLIGFFLFLIAYADVYLWLSHLDVNTFNVKLNFVKAFYFSTITSATVGYGDIVPKTDTARLCVTIQVLLTYIWLFGIFQSLPKLFAEIASKE